MVERPPLNVGETFWRVLACVAAGAVAGIVVGGVLGRLSMLLLRLTSPEVAIGLVSDDGFVVGIFTGKTFTFVIQMAFLGGANGALYAALRGALPRRQRAAAWSAFGAALGGAQIVHQDGVDFTVLEPRALAIVLFVLLPGLASLLVVVLAERAIGWQAWRRDGRTVGVILASVVGTFGLVVGAAVVAAELAVHRLGLGSLVARAGRVVVPLALAAATVAGAAGIVSDVVALL